MQKNYILRSISKIITIKYERELGSLVRTEENQIFF